MHACRSTLEDPTPGGDVIQGGDGIDSVSYADRTAAVTVDLNNNPDDGEPNENDDVRNDIESITGGAGDDRLAGDDHDNTLDGGPGSDSLSGRAGNDTLRGGAGDDAQLDGGPGGDFIAGGDGRDTASYAGRTAGVTVTLDDAADDGEPGEGDNIWTDIEEVSGGAGDDHLVGNNARNFLTGLGGNDVIEAQGGDDVINGGPGADTLSGGDGSDIADFFSEEAPITLTGDGIANDGADGEGDNLMPDIEGVIGGPLGDHLLGGPANDFIYGYDGDDLLYGGPGTDMLVSGNGDDHIQSVDGTPDFISCGDGNDTALVDAFDSVATDCENKVIAATLADVTGKVTSKSGIAFVTVTCAPLVIDRCTGTLSLKTTIPATVKKKKKARKRAAAKRSAADRVVQLGSQTFDLAPGESGVVQVKLPLPGWKLLTSARKLVVTSTLTTTDRSGSSSSAEKAFVLKAPALQKPKPKAKKKKPAAKRR